MNVSGELFWKHQVFCNSRLNLHTDMTMLSITIIVYYSLFPVALLTNTLIISHAGTKLSVIFSGHTERTPWRPAARHINQTLFTVCLIFHTLASWEPLTNTFSSIDYIVGESASAFSPDRLVMFWLSWSTFCKSFMGSFTTSRYFTFNIGGQLFWWL